MTDFSDVKTGDELCLMSCGHHRVAVRRVTKAQFFVAKIGATHEIPIWKKDWAVVGSGGYEYVKAIDSETDKFLKESAAEAKALSEWSRLFDLVKAKRNLTPEQVSAALAAIMERAV